MREGQSGPLPLSISDVELTKLPLERATQLPGAAFTDSGVFAWELENIFLADWICAGHIDQVRERGRFLTVEIDGESVIVVADDDDLPRAFLNTCRHRGARILEEPEGTVSRLRCPYHAWTYGFDGSLRKAPFTEGLTDFDPTCFALKPVALAVVEGLVLINLSGADEVTPPGDVVGDLAPLLAKYHNSELRRGGRQVYDVASNWKVIAENYNECLHCPGVHPELNVLSHYLSGEEITGAGAWCGGSMTLSDSAETMGTEGGHLNGRPPIKGLEEQDLRNVLYFALFPNSLISLHPDYVMLHTLWPEAEDRTRIVCEWFFEAETSERDDFDPSDAIAFWDQVNREDWGVCTLTQRGMSTRRFTPGRYTEQEDDVHAFDGMVADRYLEALTADTEVPR